jgi:hypothetical protein
VIIARGVTALRGSARRMAVARIGVLGSDSHRAA